MNGKPIVVAVVLLLTLTGASFVPGKYGNAYYQQLPPGTLRVDNNFYCDKAEINNVSWRVYIFWLNMVFGDNAPECKAAMPDTTVWLAYPCLKKLSVVYYRDPEYDQYPVVGISREQAIAFSKWRGDRVFERILIDMNKITEDHRPNRQTYFSIEKYFNGLYQSKTADNNTMYYPDYTLPDVKERTLILSFADSVRSAVIIKHKPASYKSCNDATAGLQVGKTPCTSNNKLSVPTCDVQENACDEKTGARFYNLRGNVAEWSIDAGICFGGNWASDTTTIFKTDAMQATTPNALTGFRNICRWKKWGTN